MFIAGMNYVVRTKRWSYVGCIPIKTHPIGFVIENKNSFYEGCDVSEADPCYRLFLMGYALFDSNIVKRHPGYKIEPGLKKILKGRCCCCFNESKLELCLSCAYGIGECAIFIS